MKYMKRAGIYKASNLDFNPKTGLGHSYDWYEITKTIQGKLVLNTYPYSVTTRKHVRKLEELIEQLYISVTRIEAPEGLQNLQAAADYSLEQWAKESVRVKYARKVGSNNLNYWDNKIQILGKLGYMSSLEINTLKDSYEAQRQDKLTSKRKPKKPKLTLIQGGAA